MLQRLLCAFGQNEIDVDIGRGEDEGRGHVDGALVGVGVPEDEVPRGAEDEGGGQRSHGGGEEPGDDDGEDAFVGRPDLRGFGFLCMYGNDWLFCFSLCLLFWD